MSKPFNFFTFTLFCILSFEGVNYYNLNNLENDTKSLIAQDGVEQKTSAINYAQLKSNIEKSSQDKETLQINYLKNIIISNRGNIFDYSNASIVLSELLYSDKYLKMQKKFDDNQLDNDDKKLSTEAKNYKELLVINNSLDDNFKEALKKYQNNDLSKNLIKFNQNISFSKQFFANYFFSVNQTYNQAIDEYKTQYMIISPDYFDFIVDHFKNQKTFTKQDYYAIIDKERKSKQ